MILMVVRRFILLSLLPLLVGCAPSEQRYCERMGTPPGSQEYGNCVRYYANQTSVYAADRNVCEMEADKVYPRALYDYGGFARVHGGYGPHGYYAGQTVSIEPDYTRNQMIDQLRMQIVGPCMSSVGWRDPYNWEAGKGAPVIKRAAPAVVPGQPLPWTR